MHQEVAVAVIVVLVVATIGAVILIGSESLGGQSQSATQSATTSNNNSLQLTSTSSQQSVASSSSTSTASGPYCLLSVPADAQIGYSVNSTFYGHVVTYSNGTQAFFSEFSCPQPVFGEKSSLIPLVYYNATTSVYAMAVAAESNSSFVAAENGSEFLAPLFAKLRTTTRRMPGYFSEDPVLTFRRNVWINPFWEDDVSEIVDLMGDDRVIFGSDWPHIEGLPEPTDWVTELQKLPRESVPKIMGGNVSELNERRPAS